MAGGSLHRVPESQPQGGAAFWGWVGTVAGGWGTGRSNPGALETEKILTEHTLHGGRGDGKRVYFNLFGCHS